MAADNLADGLADSALRVIQSLFPGSSAGAGIVTVINRSLRPIGAVGPHRHLLFEGKALAAAYRAMSEHTTLTTACDTGLTGRMLISMPVRGRDRLPLGALQVLTGAGELDAPVRVSLDALTDLIAELIQHRKLNLDLQHSLNQLFLVYEVGRLFNLASSLDDVLQQVRSQLAGTLNCRHCCILLINEQRVLVPEAGIGIDPVWVAEARPEICRSAAALVLESGVAEQVTDPLELAGLDLPALDTALPPEGVLCAPLRTRMGIVGFLELYTPTPYAFSRDEVFLLSVLAAEVATTVENAQLYASVREKESRLTVLAHKLIHSQEEERRRIARDMHDGLAQTLVSSYQFLQAHAFAVPSGANRDSLDRGLAMLAESIDESRAVISDLRPSTLDDFGLVLALRQYLSSLESDLGWTVDFKVVGRFGPLPPATETAVFRLVKEALTNARKHSGTSRIQVRLAGTGRTLAITVRDWGRGFDPRASSSHATGQFGLTGMKERVSLLNGTFHLRSKPGTGTLIRITLPVD